jgi:hypothetical protein
MGLRSADRVVHTGSGSWLTPIDAGDWPHITPTCFGKRSSMALEQFPLQLGHCWIGTKECGQHCVGELRLGDGADLVTADGHDGAVLRKEHGIVIARMHGGNHGKEPLDIRRVKTAGSHAIVFEAFTPGFTGSIGTDAALEPHCQKLGIR